MNKTSWVTTFVVLVVVGAIAAAFLSGDSSSVEQDMASATQETVISNNEIEQEIIMEEQQFTQATFDTNQGTIVLRLYSDKAPNTVANFGKLASEGFYDGTRFHRVIAGFMIQGGDPQSRDEELSDMWGTGGPGYTFDDEIYSENNNGVGTISMANAGPNTNGSQFFINVADNTFLNPKHTVFGEVIEGMDIVNAISNTETDGRDRPIEDVVITSITVE